jgi:hypothetical protein
VLTTAEIQAHLNRLSYKPGWEFKVYDGRWEGQHLVIRTEVPDTYSDQTVVLDVHSMLPPMRSRNGWRGGSGGWSCMRCASF